MKNFTVLIISLLILTSTSCIYNIKGIDGNGNIITEEKTPGSFSKIDASGAFDIILKQGETESVSIEADENLMEYIIVNNNSGRLIIDNKENISPTHDIIITVTFRDLNYIEVSGACDIKSSEQLVFNKIEFECSGASDCKLNFEAKNCKFDISGASELDLRGKSNNVEFDGSGAIDINAEEFEISECEIDLSGAAEADIFVTKSLDIDISGAASLSYKGGANITRQSVSGAASIKSK